MYTALLYSTYMTRTQLRNSRAGFSVCLQGLKPESKGLSDVGAEAPTPYKPFMRQALDTERHKMAQAKMFRIHH
jgi:hypothetical protein